jgi:hypothetical protein
MIVPKDQVCHLIECLSQSELDLKCTSTELCLRKIVSQKHEFKYMHPILTNIAEIVLTVPVSNAWPDWMFTYLHYLSQFCERLFDILKFIGNSKF